MDVKDLHLEEIKFSETPTQTQLIRSIRSIHQFLSRLGGAILTSEMYTIADQPLGVMLNAAVQLKAAADQFEAGPSKTGLVQAVPAPPAHMRQ